MRTHKAKIAGPLVTIALLASCRIIGDGSPAVGGSPGEPRSSADSAASPGAAWTGAEEDFGPGGSFGLGRPVSDDEIARWDLDVMPDGEGLPSGSGSVAEGRRLYVDACLRCHGVDGRGKPFDALVGRASDADFDFAEDPGRPRTIGSYWPFATTLFDYTRRAMPQDRPGSLSDDEVYALTAYLLHLNGLLDANASLDRETLPNVEMPARDRFVRDARRGGPEIR